MTLKIVVLILLIAAVVVGIVAVITAITQQKIVNTTAGGILDLAESLLLFAIAIAVYDRAYGKGQSS